MKLYPYKSGSKSAKVLAEALGIKRVRLSGSKLRSNRHLLINWGNPREPSFRAREWLNRPSAVELCSNKAEFFSLVDDCREYDCIPDWTTIKEGALEWKSPVIARTMLRANGGRGAYYLTHDELLNDDTHYMLYTKYFKKRDEYRVHFGPLGIFHVQQKRKRYEEDADFKIRNHDSGWVFTIHDVSPPAAVLDVCRSVMDIIPLDMGAFDVLYNAYYDQAKVTEVNTAPSLEGTTVDKYVEMIKEVIQ